MSYRKLEVEGQVFEYSIGKTHTKIRGIGAYKNEEVGKYSAIVSQRSWVIPDVAFQVRPSDLASFIKQNKMKKHTNI